MSLFKDSTGNFKWSIVPVIVAIIAAGFIILLRHEIAYNFAHNFFPYGLLQILGPIAGTYVGYLYYKKFSDSTIAEAAPAVFTQFAAVALFFGFLIGPAVLIRSNTGQGIPTANVYYSNGKIINTSDPSKENYYFKHFKVSAVDSQYIVKYDEQPGFNNYVKNRIGVDSSKAPRANEDWIAPVPIETQKLGKY